MNWLDGHPENPGDSGAMKQVARHSDSAGPHGRAETSARRLYANRRNALRSTGPRTSAGKARSAQNARRHGLNLTAECDPARADEIAALALIIAGPDAPALRLGLAWRVAAAQIDIVRVRRAKCDLFPVAGEPGGLERFAAMDFYERRALTRRRAAIRAFDAAFRPAFVKTNPMDESSGVSACSSRRPLGSRYQVDRARPGLVAVGLGHADVDRQVGPARECRRMLERTRRLQSCSGNR